MDLSPVKQEILETLLLHDEPQRATEIAKSIGKEQRPVMMHILGLLHMKYVSSPEKGAYTINDAGKAALGLSPITREKALAILTPMPPEKAFHFYVGIGRPLNIYAHDLLEFCDKIGKVNKESIEFHAKRGDFENWFTASGDAELAMKTTLLKKKTSGEELR
jgi:hypothetical protein